MGREGKVGKGTKARGREDEGKVGRGRMGYISSIPSTNNPRGKRLFQKAILWGIFALARKSFSPP